MDFQSIALPAELPTRASEFEPDILGASCRFSRLVPAAMPFVAGWLINTPVVDNPWIVCFSSHDRRGFADHGLYYSPASRPRQRRSRRGAKSAEVARRAGQREARRA